MSPAEKNDAAKGPLLSSLAETFRAELQRTVPANITVLHYLGALALVFLCLQVLTGILLMVYYRPSAEAAHYSIGIIADEVRLGWLFRSLHHWGSDLLIVLCLVHMIRVYFSQAYHAPRQLNWVSGVFLLLVVLAFDFTGALLPWDQHAYWSADSVRETLDSLPLLGSFLLTLLWGGGHQLTEEALLRSYAYHIGLLPWVALFFLLIHFRMVWQFGIKEPGPTRVQRRPPPIPFFPDFLLNLLIAFLILWGVLLSVAMLFTPSITEPADPLSPLLQVPPRWYLVPAHQLLQYVSRAISPLVVVVLFLVLFLVPVFDPGPVGSPTGKLVRRILGLVILAAWVLLGVRGYLS